jgi:hypothetical protein
VKPRATAGTLTPSTTTPSVGGPANAVQTIPNARIWAKTNANSLKVLLAISKFMFITISIRKWLPFPKPIL